MKKVVMLMPYFGKWPEWINLYLESCRHNPTIDWIFFTDCGEPENKPDNVRFIPMTLGEFRKLASSKLGTEVALTTSRKVSDLKPTYGHIFEEYTDGCDYWGYGDIDVVYGNIRKFADPLLNHGYDLISFNILWISGHFCLYKNSDEMRLKYKQIANYFKGLKLPDYQGMDERPMFRSLDKRNYPEIAQKVYRKSVFLLNRFAPSLHRLLRNIRRTINNQKKYDFDLRTFNSPVRVIKGKYHFMETYNTPYGGFPGSRNQAWPTEWYWKEGKITNNKCSEKEFLHLHFRVWKVFKWNKLDEIVHFDPKEAKNGFKINEKGFFKL